MSKDSLSAQVTQIRIQWRQSDDRRDAGLPTEIPEVTRVNDLQYGNDSQYNLLDVYLPKQHGAKIPVIVNIHGGGWVYGTKETYQFYGLGLAKDGFAVINANYRLGPEVTYPSALDDINDVFHWLAAHADDYDLDTDHVFIVGDSAGGQMGEQILAIYTNPTYRRYFNYELPQLKIRAAALNCGAYFIGDPGMITDGPAAYFPEEVVRDHQTDLQVENFLTPELPPIFLMTANNDFLRNNAWQLAGFLRAKQIFHEIHMYGDDQNPRGHVFHIDQRDELAKQCNEDELNFFRRYLK